ncbi:MAG: protease inhibitor I42 family protein [Pirellulales bacterium]
MAEILVNQAQEGKTVALQVGDVLAVALPVNMLTGLRWVVGAYDRTTLAMTGQTLAPPPPSSALGAGGTVAVFRFVAQAPGLANLVLELRHGNEPDEGVQKYRLAVEVQ